MAIRNALEKPFGLGLTANMHVTWHSLDRAREKTALDDAASRSVSGARVLAVWVSRGNQFAQIAQLSEFKSC